MKRKLNPIEKYKPLWEGGKSVEQYNIKVGFKIRMFCVNELNSLRLKNPALFGQKETEELGKMIMDLKQDKGTIKPEDQNCSLEEFQQFLSEFFQKIDYEDRHATVTLKTSSKFRVMSSFIDVLSSWGPIDEEMLKCKKYCQYKAVDIFKALKKGEIPKRGGPKEQENSQGDAGLGNEIEELSKNMENNNLGGGDNNNILRGQNPQPQQFTSYHSGGNNNNQFGQQQQFNQGNNQFGNPFGQTNNNAPNNNGFSNPFGNNNNTFNNNNNNIKNNNNFNNNNFNNNNYKQGYNNNFNNNNYNNMPKPQQQMQNQINQNNQNQYQNQVNRQQSSGMNKARKSKVFPSEDRNPQKRTFKGKYELNATIPIKYNTVDYFMLVENVRINNENALRELKRGKACNVLNTILDSLEFLSYIHK